MSFGPNHPETIVSYVPGPFTGGTKHVILCVVNTVMKLLPAKQMLKIFCPDSDMIAVVLVV